MTNFKTTISTVFVSGILITGCASTAAGEDKPDGIAAFAEDARLGEAVNKICFNRNIDGFRTMNRDTVVLQSGISDEYLVEVGGVCSNLQHAQSMAIDSSLSCVRRNDYLIVSDSAFSLDDGIGIGPDRCIIKKIHKWDKDAEQAEDAASEAD